MISGGGTWVGLGALAWYKPDWGRYKNDMYELLGKKKSVSVDW